jgi:CubicO group peptidase (beta-lactamase class C family)
LVSVLVAKATLRVKSNLRLTRRRYGALEYSNRSFGLLSWLLARRAGLSSDLLVQQRRFALLGLAPGDAPALAPGARRPAPDRTALELQPGNG